MLARAVLRIGYGSTGTRVAAPVRGDAHAAMKALDDARRRAYLDGLLAQLERHAVVAVIKLDVVVDVGARLLTLRQLEADLRQRFHGRAVEGLERPSPRARELLEPTIVELFEQLRDGVIELGEREEHAVAQSRENPALRNQHARFDLGFAFGLTGRRRDDRDAVVLPQLGEGVVDIGS